MGKGFSKDKSPLNRRGSLNREVALKGGGASEGEGLEMRRLEKGKAALNRGGDSI